MVHIKKKKKKNFKKKEVKHVKRGKKVLTVQGG